MISIRRRAEEAREALSMGLQRVRLIQEQAQSVPQLQSRITQLETELHQYRYRHCVWSAGRGGECMASSVHPFAHHLPLCSADLKFNECAKASSLSYTQVALSLSLSVG